MPCYFLVRTLHYFQKKIYKFFCLWKLPSKVAYLRQFGFLLSLQSRLPKTFQNWKFILCRSVVQGTSVYYYCAWDNCDLPFFFCWFFLPLIWTHWPVIFMSFSSVSNYDQIIIFQDKLLLGQPGVEEHQTGHPPRFSLSHP